MSRMTQSADHTYISISSGAATEPEESRHREWLEPCLTYGGFFAVCVAIILLAYFFW